VECRIASAGHLTLGLGVTATGGLTLALILDHLQWGRTIGLSLLWTVLIAIPLAFIQAVAVGVRASKAGVRFPVSAIVGSVLAALPAVVIGALVIAFIRDFPFR